MISDRKLDVLRAIVSEYVETQEPVGSKAIALNHDLGVSSATIRNDMAALEEQGLIYQPHTSAGRVPTDRGYRVFVDQLTQLKPMSQPEKRAVEAFLSQSVDLDDVVNRTVRLLAQVTHQVAIVQYPSLSTATLRRLELVDMGPGRLLLVVITNNGRIEQCMLDFDEDLDAEVVHAVNSALNDACQGLAASQISSVVENMRHQLPELAQPIIEAVSGGVVDLMQPAAGARFVLAGVSNLMRSGADVHDVSAVLDALEEQVALLRLFQGADRTHSTVQVHIGAENRHDAFVNASVVSGTYGPGAPAQAHLGVVGPTRMNYPLAITTVKAMAAYLSRFLKN